MPVYACLRSIATATHFVTALCNHQTNNFGFPHDAVITPLTSCPIQRVPLFICTLHNPCSVRMSWNFLKLTENTSIQLWKFLIIIIKPASFLWKKNALFTSWITLDLQYICILISFSYIWHAIFINSDASGYFFRPTSSSFFTSFLKMLWGNRSKLCRL